jgi:hypothetical protein
MFEMLLGWLPIILALLYFFGESFDVTRGFTQRYKSIIGWALVLSLLATLFLYITVGTLAFNYLFRNPNQTVVVARPPRGQAYMDV